MNTEISKTSIAGQSSGTRIAGTSVAGSSGTSVAAAASSAGAMKPYGESGITINGTYYRIERKIGDGGEAEVFSVLSPDNKRFALKLYRHDRGINPDIIARLSTLDGKAATTEIIVSGTIYTDGADRAYVLMNWCKDGPVSALDLRGDADTILQIAVMAARHLSELHKAGIIHKDTKPENMLFNDREKMLLVLSDFGIADIIGEDGSVNSPQDRTAIYAGPEIYTLASTIQGKTYAIMTPAYDYYSLGMSILCMWMGKDEFQKKESELVKMKIQGKISVPDDMPEPLNTITRGLLTVNTGNRWGYNEICRKLAGEDVPVSEDAETLRFLFDSGKHKTARTVKELARFMMEDQELGISYLYKGKINAALRGPMPEIETRLNDIIERDYPKNRVAGLYAAALLLDPELPYYDRNGDVYDTIIPLLNSEAEFSGNLGDRSNPVYIYQEARSGKQAADQLFAKVERAIKDPFGYGRSVLVWALYDDSIYMEFEGKVNPSDDKYTSVPCYTLQDFISFVSTYRIVKDDDKKFICSLGFAEFVRVFSEKDADAIIGLRNLTNNYEILFRLIVQQLNPLADIFLRTNPDDRSYAMDGPGIAGALNTAFITYYTIFKGNATRMRQEWLSEANIFHDIEDVSGIELLIDSFTKDYDSSYLHLFFMTKIDRFDRHDEWARYCTDYNSSDNAGKYGPYDHQIAMMKTISGFGVEPAFYFQKSNRFITSVKDLPSIPSGEIKSALQSGSLHAWLAVNYQENPHTDLSTKYTFEKLTEKYLGTIGRYDSDDYYYKRFKKAKNSVEAHKSFPFVLCLGGIETFFTVLLGIIPCLIAIMAIAFRMFDSAVLPEDFAVKAVVGALSYIIFAILIIHRYAADYPPGCATYVILFFLLRFAMSFLVKRYIGRLALFILLAAAIGFMIYFCLKIFTPNRGADKLRSMRNATFSQLVVEPLHFAYKESSDTFLSSLFHDEKRNKSMYKDDLKGKIKYIILFFITSVLLIYATGKVCKLSEDGKFREQYPKLYDYVTNIDKKHENVPEVQDAEQE